MKKRHHIILGFVMNFIFIYLTIYLGWKLFDLSYMNVFITSLIISVYSILPDIDHKNSAITWIFLGIGILGLLVGIFELAVKTGKFNPILVLVFSTLFLIFTFVAGNFLKHRGFIHSIIVGILSFIPLFFIFHSLAYCLVAYVSWHSHLLGDGLVFKVK